MKAFTKGKVLGSASLHRLLKSLRTSGFALRDFCMGWLRRVTFLHHRDFSIISSNCLAGEIYRQYALPYRTPTVGLFFFGDDYLRFIEDLPRNLTRSLSFRASSQHEAINEMRSRRNLNYPIGVLGDLEIQFLHYGSEAEAREKWERRCARVNPDNLFFIYNDLDGFKEEFFSRFETLPYPRKIFLSARRRPSPCCICIEEYEGQPCIGDLFKDPYLARHFDVAGWLNENKTRRVPGGKGTASPR
jgi:uncharacterized protein (DUF1919 family)